MVNIFFATLAATALLTGSLASIAPERTGTAKTERLQNPPQNQATAIAAGTYVGTIPCTDCEGILIELTLKDAQGSQGRRFQMKQTFLASTKSRNTSSEMEGIWFAAKGNKQNPKAVILQLIPTSGNYDPSFFMLVNKTQLNMLDRGQNEIKRKGKQNYTLKKQ